MKRLSLAIIFACCTLAIAAQEGFRVHAQVCLNIEKKLFWSL